MVIVYPKSLIYMFAPLVGMADEGVSVAKTLRPPIVNERSIKEIYEKELRLPFSSMDPRIQSICKVALQHILFAANYVYENEFYSMLLPFGCPIEPRLAFLWLWEVLFPAEVPSPLEQPFELDERADPYRYITKGY